MKSAPARVTSFLAAIMRRIFRPIGRHPVLFAAAIPLIAVGVGAAFAASYVSALIPLTPDVAAIRKFQDERPTVVLSADGKELAVFKRADRKWVKLADISPHVIEALVATEDRRFFEHPGIDVRRTATALLHTLRGDREGGSTITQQLARNLYPEEIGRAPTLTRKIKEAITALKIEKAYSKEEILETYLNTVPFLYNSYGIELAARTYFDKTASELDVLESATLIGMLKGTSHYNPVTNPERSLARRNIVLGQMVRNQRLTPAQFEELKTKPLELDFERQTEEPGPAPHMIQQLRHWLIDWGDRNGYDIRSAGLVVHTTIDSRLQEMATEAVARQADKLQATADKAWRLAANAKLLQTFLRETPGYKAARAAGSTDEQALKKLQSDSDAVQALWRNKTRLQAGFMAMEPGTGQVRAWVGSRDFEQDQFDHVAQARRQPGSTFKPFVYGAAFEQGMSPNETFIDEALEYRVDERTTWRPVDIESASGRPMTARDALAQSRNTITAQVMQRVGPARVAKVAHDLGVRDSRLDAVPSLALGTSPVTLKEMVAAYGAIANNGNYVEPVLVTRIENREHATVADFRPKPPQAGLSVSAAQMLLDVMRGVIDRGTGAGIRSRFGIRGDVAGKTGTTQDYTDGWFILMHPQLVGGAWVGFNDNRVTMRNDAWGQGARNALYIVGDFFQQSLKAKAIDAKARFDAPRLPPPPPPAPETVPGTPEWLALQAAGQTSPANGAMIVAAPPVEARPATDVLSGPPSRGFGEFQWIPEPPRGGDEPPRPARRRVERVPEIVMRRSGSGERQPRIMEFAPDGGTNP
ncbi:MAG: transglycosylase domain-containing protein [Ramlibacter sp.]